MTVLSLPNPGPKISGKKEPMVQDGPVHVIREHQVVTEDQAGYGLYPR